MSFISSFISSCSFSLCVRFRTLTSGIRAPNSWGRVLGLYSFAPLRPPDPDDFRRMMQIANDETASRCREIKETLTLLRSEFRQLMSEFIASPSPLLEGAFPPIYRPETQSSFVTPPPTHSPKTQSLRLQFRPPPLTQPTAESYPRLGDAQSLLVLMSRIKQASGETIPARRSPLGSIEQQPCILLRSKCS